MLVNTIELKPRFSEIDSMGIVWHGHYVRYFEDGREAFGKEYGLHYLEVYKNGFLIPIVKLDCNYKKPIFYTDTCIVETSYIDTAAAKIVFSYKIINQESGDLCATGCSEQVFINNERELQLIAPDFYIDWKRKNNI
ncbi:acyl-CoA thioesterase [Cytophagaceae bacterium ABcell3]|nr:acyl-CoA thioesterase [Cytophagaceae bacterium ABcell3]